MGVIDRAILQDEIRQALNGLFLNGQAGRKETKRISYNSDTDAKEIIPYGNQYYARVLDEPIPLTQENFKRVVVSMSIANLEPAVSVGSKADGTAFVEQVAEMGGAICVFITIDGDVSDYPAIAVFEQDLPAELTGVAIKKGVYFISETEPEAKLETILEYETIHPIDQKFLPGAVVNLCDYGINIYELIQKGTSGYFVMDTALAQKLNEKIPTDGSRVVLVTDDGVNPILHDQSALIACTRDGVAGAISSFCATAYPSMNAVLYIDVHVAFTFNTESGAVDATRVYYNISTKELPTTEVS